MRNTPCCGSIGAANTVKAWLALLAAGLLEIAWAFAEIFRRPDPFWRRRDAGRDRAEFPDDGRRAQIVAVRHRLCVWTGIGAVAVSLSE